MCRAVIFSWSITPPFAMKMTSFCEWLVKEGGVAAIPLDAVLRKGAGHAFVRLCFAKSDATMEAAAERLCKL
jgi:methionine aminotransferase